MSGRQRWFSVVRWLALLGAAAALVWFVAFRRTDSKPAAASEPRAATRLSAPEVREAVKRAEQPEAPAPAPAPARPAQAQSPAAALQLPVSTIRADFEHEPRDAAAPAAEARIRALFAAEPGADGVLRGVTCSRTVCKIDARWSQAQTDAYNAALVHVVKEFSREMSFEPGGAPEGVVMPMAIYVRRPTTGPLAGTRP
jgi:hypothetical protein